MGFEPRESRGGSLSLLWSSRCAVVVMAAVNHNSPINSMPPLDKQSLITAAFACCLAVRRTIFGGDQSTTDTRSYLQNLQEDHGITNYWASDDTFQGQVHLWASKPWTQQSKIYFFACRESAEPSDWLANLSGWSSGANVAPGNLHAGTYKILDIPPYWNLPV